MKVELIDVNEKNIVEHPPKCFLNVENEGYLIKREWLETRFTEGLKIKLLYLEDKCAGFIEYVPGEYAWRAVDAKDCMFIQCIWISPNKHKEKGYGSILVKEVIKEAQKAGKIGVAAVTSEGPFMAGKELFIKNGFMSAASAKPTYELMFKKLKDGPQPKFMDTEKQLKEYAGLNIVYSNQCPWVARFIKELEGSAQKKKLTVTELKTAKEAQNAPSIYATFSLIKDGKLLADHYISNTRFQNIINKEMK